MQYRPEIDGLRALAVLPVILFHAGFELFGGGYAGVDVFFVISGYLISSILLNEVSQQKFSIIRFYERRIRRILPALYVVMLASIPVPWLLFSPPETKVYFQSLTAVTLFSSNFLFFLQSGYFDLASELKPLLHTWSLSVEEQFYLFFPLFLLVLTALWLKVLVPIVLILMASLLYANYEVYSNPSAAFFLLPSRMWELLVGALAAAWVHYYGLPNISQRHREIFSLLGIIAILFSVFVYDHNTPFPSFYTLVPTVGTALILLFARDAGFVVSLLRNRVLVGIGLLSYSLYLWHQPLIAFIKYQHVFQATTAVMLLAVLLTFPLSYLTWRFVETPFRDRNRINTKILMFSTVIMSGFFVIAGVVGHVKEGFRDRFVLPPNIQWISLGDKIDQAGEACSYASVEDYPGVIACYFGDLTSSTTVALYGDSHADAMLDETHRAFEENGIKGLRVFNDGCGTVPLITKLPIKDAKAYYRDCAKAQENVALYVEEQADALLLFARWTLIYYPILASQENHNPQIPLIDSLGFDNTVGGVEHIQYRENVAVQNGGSVSLGALEKQQATQHFLARLSQNIPVYLHYPVPEIGWDIYKENLEYYTKNGKPLETLAYPFSVYQQRHQFAINVLDVVSNQNPNIVPVQPSHVFCDTLVEAQCVAQFNSEPLYLDDDHLSNAGARLLLNKTLSKIDLVKR